MSDIFHSSLKQLFCHLILPLVNRNDLHALVGPHKENPELDPLFVLHLANQLYIALVYTSANTVVFVLALVMAVDYTNNFPNQELEHQP